MNKKMELGAQFYTIRQFCGTPEGIAESLKKVADIGYKTVQISGTCDYDPAWLKSELDKNGLRCVLTHTPGEKLKADPVKIARDHDILNCKYVGLGWFGFDDKNKKTTADFINDFKETAHILHEYGKYFMYHNHDLEFNKEDGRLIIEKLAEEMPADEMGFTLDTFWIQAVGADPSEWIERLKGRIPCIHLKDFAFGKRMSVIGEGNMNFDRILEKADSSDVEYLLVEQDECYGEDPFDCLKRSYDHLHSLGLE